MSVILECQPGDEFICIGEFHASPDGEGFSWDTARRFRVGERLRYVSYRKDLGPCDHPTQWHVVFDTADGKRYAATQTYFVTEETWQKLKKFFAKRLLREPKRQRSP